MLRRTFSHFSLRVVLTAAAITIAIAISLPLSANERPHVVMISIDGLMPSCLLRADELGLQIPNLDRLMKSGAWAEGVTGVLPTKTYPSHTTLVTGVPPLMHGIYANGRFDPKVDPNNGFFWFAEEIRTETLVSAAGKAGLSTATVYWPVSVGIGATWTVPEIWFPSSTHGSDVRLLRLLSSPGLLDAAIGRERLDRMGSLADFTDVERTDSAAWIIRRHRPDLVLLHVFGLDFAQHDYTPMSREALEWIEKSDAFVGTILAAIHDAGMAESTTVVVVSDHGFEKASREVRPNVLLAQLGLITVDTNGRVVDWRAIFESQTGSALLHARDEEAVDIVRSIVTPLLADADSGILALASREEARKMGLDVPLAIDARTGYRFSDRLDGPYLSEEQPARGEHGYFPTRPELLASFIISGPAIVKKGSLGTIRMTTIAPTIASILGLSLDPAADEALPLFEVQDAHEQQPASQSAGQ